MKNDEYPIASVWQDWALAAIFATVVAVLVWNVSLMVPRSGTLMVFSYNAKDCVFPKPEEISTSLARSSAGGGWIVRDRRTGNDGTFEALRDEVADSDSFKEAKRVVSSMMDCGPSYCEGTAARADRTVSAELLARKRRGEDVVLPGCEQQPPNFHLDRVSPGRLGVRPFNALLCLALAANIVALLYYANGLQGRKAIAP
jgi:hypothetical protein